MKNKFFYTLVLLILILTLTKKNNIEHLDDTTTTQEATTATDDETTTGFDIGQMFQAEVLLCELTFLDSSEGEDQIAAPIGKRWSLTNGSE